MPEDLTFLIQPADTQSASVDLFFKALENIRRLLRDVDYAIYRERTARRWVISRLHSSAPSVTVEPLLGNSELVNSIAVGIRAVTTGTDQPPQYFTEQALEDLKRMRWLFVGKDRARSVIVSVDNEETATIREDIAAKANRILASGYWDMGSLEGTLEAINLHGPPRSRSGTELAGHR